MSADLKAMLAWPKQANMDTKYSLLVNIARRRRPWSSSKANSESHGDLFSYPTS